MADNDKQGPNAAYLGIRLNQDLLQGDFGPKPGYKGLMVMTVMFCSVLSFHVYIYTKCLCVISVLS